ncbi:hypothetical protein MLD38_031356 [Melastoma candidum]|uniref:Uncharacterized protein n=1 Tax=Melastoma candidum TaxID=119954 RepID=A0ACB9MQZ6_9MYRT|nr:hypothetical protein MLD38_031356 [Melastoma candidum]
MLLQNSRHTTNSCDCAVVFCWHLNRNSFPWSHVNPLQCDCKAGREIGKDVKQQHPHPGKGKRLLKALLSRRKSRKDEMLYTCLDEYCGVLCWGGGLSVVILTKLGNVNLFRANVKINIVKEEMQRMEIDLNTDGAQS